MPLGSAVVSKFVKVLLRGEGLPSRGYLPGLAQLGLLGRQIPREDWENMLGRAKPD